MSIRTHIHLSDLEQIRIKPEILLFKNTFSSIRLFPASTAQVELSGYLSYLLISSVWSGSTILTSYNVRV